MLIYLLVRFQGVFVLLIMMNFFNYLSDLKQESNLHLASTNLVHEQQIKYKKRAMNVW